MVYYKRLTDSKIITKFLTEPELWDRVSEYGQQAEDFEAPVTDAWHWIGLYTDGTLLGIGCIHATNSSTAVVHINIQHKYRHEFAVDGGKLILKYFLRWTDFDKLNAEVPVTYKAVVEFTKSMGFRVEGLNRKSINKHNGLVDQVNLGQTRTEIKEFLRS